MEPTKLIVTLVRDSREITVLMFEDDFTNWWDKNPDNYEPATSVKTCDGRTIHSTCNAFPIIITKPWTQHEEEQKEYERRAVEAKAAFVNLKSTADAVGQQIHIPIPNLLYPTF